MIQEYCDLNSCLLLFQSREASGLCRAAGERLLCVVWRGIHHRREVLPDIPGQRSKILAQLCFLRSPLAFSL